MRKILEAIGQQLIAPCIDNNDLISVWRHGAH